MQIEHPFVSTSSALTSALFSHAERERSHVPSGTRGSSAKRPKTGDPYAKGVAAQGFQRSHSLTVPGAADGPERWCARGRPGGRSGGCSPRFGSC